MTTENRTTDGKQTEGEQDRWVHACGQRERNERNTTEESGGNDMPNGSAVCGVAGSWVVEQLLYRFNESGEGKGMDGSG